MELYIDPALCPQNHPCPLVARCPAEDISQEGVGLPVIDSEKCIGCEECLRSCGKQAVTYR